jgi:hypothetical protein
VKITGLILAMVGLVGGLICMVALFQPTHPTTDTGVTGTDQRSGMMIPLVVCGAALVIGLLMFALGGRGYWVINNPRVRN